MIHVPAGEGPALWVPEDTVSPDATSSVKATYIVKATAEITGGSLSFVEASVPPGSGPPPHVHADSDEAYYILSGRFEVLDGDRTLVAKPGDFVYIPRNTLHRFKNVGVDAARLLFLFTPAGFERLFFEVGQPARPGEPAPLVGPDDVRKAAEVGPRFFGA
ncbi:Cupin 2 [Carbonactinospora thermoautotrophica]|uniref:Cupin 2 n=1 Tax=Carbonactinospora thermoautotrophica TaxID=1469144 RepID=A0A132MUE3_9ACTN|nr:Cupin 2 [Carbonactinospora thermoautotrophica]